MRIVIDIPNDNKSSLPIYEGGQVKLKSLFNALKQSGKVLIIKEMKGAETSFILTQFKGINNNGKD
jgi:hypothetical protein